MRNATYKLQFFACCISILILNFSQTPAVAFNKPQDQFKELQKEVKRLKQEKNLNKVRDIYPKMWVAYTKIYDNQQIGKKEKLNAGFVMIKAFVEEGECQKALELCNKLLKLPELSSRDKLELQCNIGDVTQSRGLYTQAVKEYEKALNLPGINDSEKFYVYEKIAILYWRKERNPDKLKETIERMLPLNKTTLRLNAWFKRLAIFRFPQTSYTAPENLEFAWNNILKQEKITAKDKAQAYSGLIEAKLKLGKIKDAKQIAETTKADKSISTETHLLAALVLAGIDSIERKKIVDQDVLEQLKNNLKPSRRDLYNALNGAAAALRCLNEGQVARQYTEIAKNLTVSSKKAYLCRYMEKPPLGASGWLMSDLLANPDFREVRFEGYSQKDAAELITDVNAERTISSKAKNKELYFKNTAFYMAYDQDGWHIFVLCGEPKLKQMLLDGTSPGALEMFFAPGADRAYYHWIISLGNGKLSTFDWNSPHRFFRQIDDYLKTEVITVGDKIGIRIFFPWEMVYDKLPFSSDKEWIFEIIRWTPAGGISWSGGKVHNTGKWGQIKWQSPDSAQLLQIQKNLLRKAWSKYKKTRTELVNDYWASRDFGDPEFYNTVLAPEVKRLNELGNIMEEPDKLSNADIKRLYKEAMSDWMEFNYKVSELRRDYLAKQLTAAP